jgi:hypothetical protein
MNRQIIYIYICCSSSYFLYKYYYFQRLLQKEFNSRKNAESQTDQTERALYITKDAAVQTQMQGHDEVQVEVQVESEFVTIQVPSPIMLEPTQKNGVAGWFSSFF